MLALSGKEVGEEEEQQTDRRGVVWSGGGGFFKGGGKVAEGQRTRDGCGCAFFDALSHIHAGARARCLHFSKNARNSIIQPPPYPNYVCMCMFLCLSELVHHLRQ